MPWTLVHQLPLSMGFSRKESWSGLPFPSPGDLPNPGMEPRSPALAGGFLTTEPLRKPILRYCQQMYSYESMDFCEQVICPLPPPAGRVHISASLVLGWVARITWSRGRVTTMWAERPSASLALYAWWVPASEQPWHMLSLHSSAPRKMGDTWKDLSHTSSWSEVQLTCSLKQNCSAKSSLDQPVHTLLQTHEQEINAPWCKPLSLGVVFFLSTICG